MKWYDMAIFLVVFAIAFTGLTYYYPDKGQPVTDTMCAYYHQGVERARSQQLVLDQLKATNQLTDSEAEEVRDAESRVKAKRLALDILFEESCND